MAKLVAFYSRADENYFGSAYRYITIGNTEKAANMIVKLTGAELLKIEQKVPYAADYNTCIAQAKKDKQKNARPELVSIPESLAGYDEIYLGYPNYWGTMPMAVYTFLERFNWTGKTIHPFCTHEGSGMTGTERDIAKVAEGAKVTKGLAIHGSEEGQAALRELLGDNLGEGSFVAPPLRGACVERMKIGKRVSVVGNLLAIARGGITLEDDVLIAANVRLISNNHDLYDRMVLPCKPVLIKKGAWIGAGATILPGVCVGRYAIVGAGSVVTKDVPDYSFVVENPAKVIRMLDAERCEAQKG